MDNSLTFSSPHTQENISPQPLARLTRKRILQNVVPLPRNIKIKTYEETRPISILEEEDLTAQVNVEYQERGNPSSLQGNRHKRFLHVKKEARRRGSGQSSSVLYENSVDECSKYFNLARVAGLNLPPPFQWLSSHGTAVAWVELQQSEVLERSFCLIILLWCFFQKLN